MRPLIVILGPTASGKSALAVRLAKRFGGEVVSADSRRVYRGLDIGTGKITQREMKGVSHHLLDVRSPKQQMSVAEYAALANKSIAGIQARERLPFLVGGTGLYVDTVARGLNLPEVPPDPKLRKRLAKKSAADLFRMLKTLDPDRAKTIDRRNPRRLIRAIEITQKTKKPIPALASQNNYRVLFLGVKRTPEELRKRIEQAIEKRIRRGVIQETKRLIARGVSQKRLKTLGLDYSLAAEFLTGRLTRPELRQKLVRTNWDYAKRQTAWFKKHPDIHWIRSESEAARLIKKFLKR